MVLTFVLPTEQSHLGTIEELLSGGKHPGALLPRCLRPSAGEIAPPAQPRPVPSSCSILIPASWGQAGSPTDEQAEVWTREAEGLRKRKRFWEMGMGLVVSPRDPGRGSSVGGGGGPSLTPQLPGPGPGARWAFQR